MAMESGKWVLMATVRAPTNIAVIKYWGKRDEALILAINNSISVTLDPDHLSATTTVAVSPGFDQDRMWLNGKAIQPPPPNLCGSPNGPPITSSRIKLKDGRYVTYIETGVPKEKAKHKIIFIHGFDSCKYDMFPLSQAQIWQQGDFESLHRDMMVGFGKWEFDLMDLENPFPQNEGSFHLWHGAEDLIVPVIFSRYISDKLPWI